MIIECKQCHARFGASYAIHAAGVLIAAALLAGILGGWLSKFIGGWVFLLVLPLWLFIGWLIWEALRWWTILRFCRRRCPKCGARDWSKPRHGVFS
jgi:hypothetical protein